MHLWIFARAARFIVLASLAVAGCGGEGATNPAVSDGTTTPADSIPDPNPDRLARTFSYGANSSPLSLFQMTKDGRLTTPFFSSAKYDLLPEWSNDGKKLVRTSGGGDEASLWVANADLTGLRQLGAYVLYERYEETDPEQPQVCTMYKIPAAGGASVNLSPDRGAGYCGGASWRPM